MAMKRLYLLGARAEEGVTWGAMVTPKFLTSLGMYLEKYFMVTLEKLNHHI